MKEAKQKHNLLGKAFELEHILVDCLLFLPFSWFARRCVGDKQENAKTKHLEADQRNNNRLPGKTCELSLCRVIIFGLCYYYVFCLFVFV